MVPLMRTLVTILFLFPALLFLGCTGRNPPDPDIDITIPETTQETTDLRTLQETPAEKAPAEKAPAEPVPELESVPEPPVSETTKEPSPDGISGPLREVVAAGVITELDVDCNECAHFTIADEASGASYDLVSDPRNPNGGVDLRSYVGQRVSIYGLPQMMSTGDPNLLFVTRVEAPSRGSD
jgi:hypothetical protein